MALCGELAGAAFRFDTDAPELAAYAGHHLGQLLGEPQSTPSVTSILRWHEGQPPARGARAAELDTCARVDRDLYIGDERLYWFRVDDLRDLHLQARWRNECLEVEGDFYFRVGNGGWQDRVRRWVTPARVEAMRRRRFTTLLSYLLYYPCWWWLEHVRGLHPIHAGAVALGDRVVLLAGASGVGKSTLSVALAGRPEARFLSDSFVMHKGTEVHAVPEPVLLDDWSRRWLGTAAENLERIEYPYVLGRQGHQVSRGKRVDRGNAELVVFPRRGPEPYARRLSAEQAHQRLSSADMIINDLRRYFAFAAVFEQLAPAGLVALREASIASLTAEAACYEVGLTPAAGSAEVADSIAKLLSSQHLRMVGQRP